MKIANLIIFHDDPRAIERILKAMQHPGCSFYLHLDKKVDIKPYQYLTRFPNTFFVKDRQSVRWAGYSQLEAIVATIGEIIESGIEYDFINLLSGQDYPIKPVTQIYNFLFENQGKSFLMSETPPSHWWGEALSRFQKYHFIDYGFPGKFRIGNVLSSILPQRKFPFPVQLYGGPNAAYWILDMEAARYVHTFLTSSESNKWFFKHTWGPDEFLINTLLMHSPFKDTIVNENYHFLDRSQGGSRPKTLTSEDFDQLRNSNKFFARKFDRKVDHAILDRIDEELLFLQSKKAYRISA
jgi:hypothetical protein